MLVQRSRNSDTGGSVGIRSGRKRPGRVSRSAMPDRWAVGEEGGAYRGDAAVKSRMQPGDVTSWAAWSAPQGRGATTRGMLGAESSCSRLRLRRPNRKPDAQESSEKYSDGFLKIARVGGPGYGVRSPVRMRVAKLYGFSGNRIIASKPMARKMRKPANNPPGATECSRTWPPWTTLTPLRQPPTGRSGARCGHCPVERVGASLEGKLLSEPQGVLHRGDTETRRKRGDPEGLRCGGPPCLHGGPLPESPTRP